MQFISLQNNENMFIQPQLTPLYLLFCGAIIVASFFVANTIGSYCSNRWGGNEVKAKFICQAIAICTAIAFLLRYGVSMLTLQAVIYCGVCLFSSYSDFKTRTLDDCAHCVILGIAFMGRTIYDIPAMLIAALIIGGITLFVGVISKGGGIGGADIKYAATSAMMVGLQSGLMGTMVGLLIAVIVTAIKNKKSGKKEGFPLVPYLAIGYMAAMFLMS